MKLIDAPWRHRAAWAAFGFAAIIFQSPAQAQYYGGWGPYSYPRTPMPPPVVYPEAEQPAYPPIPPGTIRRMVTNMGLRLVAAPRQKGRIYLAETEDPHGQRRRVVFDAYDGTVIQNVPLAARPKSTTSLAPPSQAKTAAPEMPKPRPPDLAVQPPAKPAEGPAKPAPHSQSPRIPAGAEPETTKL